MIELLQKKAAGRGHEVEADTRFGFPARSGRYRAKCWRCDCDINYYEGEFFGTALDRDCKEKGDQDE